MKTLAPIAAAVLTLAGQASAQPAAERRFDVQDFDRIDLAGCDRVIIVPGQPFAIVARGAPAILAATSIEKHGATLAIRPLRNRCSSSHGATANATITIAMPTLAGVTVSGAGGIEARGVSGDKFVAEESGAGSLLLTGLHVTEARFGLSGGSHARIADASLGRLASDANGAGAITTAGHARALAIDASGGAQIDTRALAADALTVTASGAAVVRSTASGPSAIRASGASHVTVGGHPACTVDRNGVATVSCG